MTATKVHGPKCLDIHAPTPVARLPYPLPWPTVIRPNFDQLLAAVSAARLLNERSCSFVNTPGVKFPTSAGAAGAEGYDRRTTKSLAAHGVARGHRTHVPERERPAAMLIDPSALERRDVMDLVNGLVAPRPIAWVSTVDRLGVRNLAPFSFFNAFSTQPPTVAIGPGSRQGINKDSLRNIKDTREFVLNVVSYELAVRVNQTQRRVPSRCRRMGRRGCHSRTV